MTHDNFCEECHCAIHPDALRLFLANEWDDQPDGVFGTDAPVCPHCGTEHALPEGEVLLEACQAASVRWVQSCTHCELRFRVVVTLAPVFATEATHDEVTWPEQRTGAQEP